mmetsp:Transcript_100131/g.158438  ORF Transcript_100131/g.158438 Transcript_100131/m.158438 type:complete len:626 (-) Transcript_100131:246-2123(-)
MRAASPRRSQQGPSLRMSQAGAGYRNPTSSLNMTQAVPAVARTINAGATQMVQPKAPTSASIAASSPAYRSITYPHVLYVTLHKGEKEKGKVKRRTLNFHGIKENRGYWVGKHCHLYFENDWFKGACYVMSKQSPNAPIDRHIYATCSSDPKDFTAPEKGWESDKFDIVTVTAVKPKDWTEGDINESRLRVSKLMSTIKKKEKDGEWNITVKDICRNIDAVKEILPELLTEFPKIDADGNGRVTIQELENYFDPAKKREYTKEKLDEIWTILTSKRKEDRSQWANPDVLTLEDLALNLEFIDEKVPELMECFQEIDIDKTCRINRGEFDAYFGNADIWLESKLENIIGLGDLKGQLTEFYWQQRLDRLRRRGGALVNNDEAIVIMFKGHPGTGKTTIGRLLTGLLFKIGVIKEEVFVECQRDDLVGDHIGATEKLTSAKIDEASGGVLFVDEAYRLTSDVFGVEAINTLMKAMTVKGTVMILAGYPKQMDEFVAANPGLARRITYQLEFPNYDNDDLARILQTQIEKRGFKLDDSVTIEFMSKCIEGSTNSAQRSAFNGGIGEHVSRHAIFNLNRREMAGVKNGGIDIPSITILPEDIEKGCKHIPPPPPEEGPTVQASSRVTVS